MKQVVLVPVFRLIESTAWHLGAAEPTPIFITLACHHVVASNSKDVTDAMRQADARPVLHEGGIRVEMRCARCESVQKGTPS